MLSRRNYKSAQIYLERILSHIQKIQKYLSCVDRETFLVQDLEYDAICMQLAQIGENVSKIESSPDHIIQRFPTAVKWKALKGLRNRIDHDYTWLEAEKVWSMLESDIDDLEAGIKQILSKRYGIS